MDLKGYDAQKGLASVWGGKFPSVVCLYCIRICEPVVIAFLYLVIVFFYFLNLSFDDFFFFLGHFIYVQLVSEGA